MSKKKEKKKWKDMSKGEKRGTIIVAVILLLIISSFSGNNNSKAEKTTEKETNAVATSKSIPEPTQPKTVEEELKDKYGDQCIMGSVFYIKGLDQMGKADWLPKMAKLDCKDLAPYYDYLASQGVDTVCVWYETGVVDKYGNKSTDTAYRINISLAELQNINWENDYAVDIEALAEDVFIHPSYN